MIEKLIKHLEKDLKKKYQKYRVWFNERKIAKHLAKCDRSWEVGIFEKHPRNEQIIWFCLSNKNTILKIEHVANKPIHIIDIDLSDPDSIKFLKSKIIELINIHIKFSNSMDKWKNL